MHRHRPKSSDAVGRATFAHKNRQAHFGDPKDYGQIGFEKRVKQLANSKVVRSGLNCRVIETWINDTLIDASHLEIPGVILKPESKKPLFRYGIDRTQLN